MTNTISRTASIAQDRAELDIKTLKEDISALNDAVKDEFIKNESLLPELKGQDIISACKEPESKGLFSSLKTAGTVIGGVLTGYAIGEISKNMELNEKDNGNVKNTKTIGEKDVKVSSIKAEEKKWISDEDFFVKEEISECSNYCRFEDIIESVNKDSSVLKDFIGNKYSGEFKNEAVLSSKELAAQNWIKEREKKNRKVIEENKKADNDGKDPNPEKGKVEFKSGNTEVSLTYNDKECTCLQKNNSISDGKYVCHNFVYIDNDKQTIFKEVTTTSEKSLVSNVGYYINKSNNAFFIWDMRK